MSIQPWPPEKKLQAVDGGKNWKNDPDYLHKFYLGSQSKENLGDGTSVRLDLGLKVVISHLIASKKLPYKDTSEFLRDAGMKIARWHSDNMDDPELARVIHMVEVNAQAIHDEKVMDMNEKFLKSRKKQLDNAISVSEATRVLRSCQEARQHFEGKQLKELESLIAECEGRLK